MDRFSRVRRKGEKNVQERSSSVLNAQKIVRACVPSDMFTKPYQDYASRGRPRMKCTGIGFAVQV